MNIIAYILWNPDLEAFHIGGFGFRWYSLCWLIGLLLAYLVVKRLYKEQQIKDELFDPLFLYCFMGILIGARLGHCIFYQPDYFLTSWKGFVEMLLPIHIDQYGSWHMTGGTLGLILALILYVRHTGVGLWRVMDNIAIATGITACFIRLGNLMNSEIVGKVITRVADDAPWYSFWFTKVDPEAAFRHPGQLYEAIAYAVFFILSWIIYRKRPQMVGTGFYFGFCLFYIFTFRFFIEYTKEVQEAFEEGLPFDMGQLLSVPFVVVGGYYMVKGWKKAQKLS